MRHENVLVIYSLFSPLVFPIDLLSIAIINLSLKRRKRNPQNSDTQNIAVIVLKSEQNGLP